jgi:hypothetical protein
MYTNSVRELQNIGVGKKCIIYGGGTSLDDFPKHEYRDCVKISTNQHRWEQADIIVYYDPDLQAFYSDKTLRDGVKLIGFYVNSGCDRLCKTCTHHYGLDDAMRGDTGFITMQLADRIFNFSVIYLAGFDYYTVGGRHHESRTPGGDCAKFEKMSIGVVLPLYHKYTPHNSIFKCNEKSPLPFEHRMP